MSALPVIVEWGGVISKILVVGIAGGAVAAFQAVRKWRDLGPVREDIHRMALSIDEPREGPIAIRGCYRTNGDERHLECSGEGIVLEGDVGIVRGTTATWKAGTRTYALHDGDIVIAVGKMTRRAGGEVTGYREAAGGWTLAPSAGETAIQLATASPVATPKPLWPVRGVVVLGLVGAVAFYGLGWIGVKLVEIREYPRTDLVADDEVSTFRAELASALPRARERALIRLDADLSYKPQTEHVLEERVALAHLDGCVAESALLAQLERHANAIEVVRDCGHPESAGASLIALGRYDEAAQIMAAAPASSHGVDRLIAAIGAGRWRDAAMLVETRTAPGEPEAQHCVAQYLKSLAGEPISTLEPSNATCRVVAGILAPRDERDQYFSDKRDEYDNVVQTARWAFAGTPGNFGFESVFVAMWFAPYAVVQDSELTHLYRGQLEMALGHFDLAAAEFAKATVARVPTDNAELRAFWVTTDRRLGQLVALRSGKPIAAFELDRTNPDAIDSIDEAAAVRSGVPVREAVRHIRVYPDGCRAALISALADAVAGDGLPLARVFEGCQASTIGVQFDAEYLYAVAPSVTSHREELATAIRNWRTDGGSPFGHVRAFAVKRDLARLLGDTAEAARLQEIIERHAKVYADRDRVTAMFVAFVR